MCGIAGIWHRRGGGLASQTVLNKMSRSIAHRGPDDVGHYTDRVIGLAHQRLSIIDLSNAGHQPMTTPDGRFTITFNGEIYNYRALRDRYLGGVSFRSESDTEVLLHLIASQGLNALNLIRGMYAFAVWDKVEQCLLLARDPFGKKPLYYAEIGSTFIFASEIKALLKHPLVSKDIDRQALAKYFLFEYVPAPATIYRPIKQLPMGSYLKVTSQEITINSHWRPKFLPKTSTQPQHELLSKFDQLLSRAVARRMIADVPVGLFLSGGIDSTTIGWYMRQSTSKKLHSFSVSFRERSFDESLYARRAANFLNFTHHSLDFTVEVFHRTLNELLPLVDHPFADASLLPTYAVSKLAKREITVALDGDGSDELLAGYGTFLAHEVAAKIHRLPRPITRALQAAVHLLPTRYNDFSLDFKAKTFLKGLSYDLPLRNQVWLGSFSPTELKNLLAKEWHAQLAHVFDDINKLDHQLRDLPVIDQVSLLTATHYLHNSILVKLDRSTMYNSIEARTPFLDTDLADFIFCLPAAAKRNKWLLKKLMQNRIPQQIVKRPKKGFGIPLGFWLRGPLYTWARTILAEKKLHSDGILQPAETDRLLLEHRQGKADHRKKLWTLLSFQLWYDHWIAKRS